MFGGVDIRLGALVLWKAIENTRKIMSKEFIYIITIDTAALGVRNTSRAWGKALWGIGFKCVNGASGGSDASTKRKKEGIQDEIGRTTEQALYTVSIPCGKAWKDGLYSLLKRKDNEPGCIYKDDMKLVPMRPMLRTLKASIRAPHQRVHTEKRVFLSGYQLLEYKSHSQVNDCGIGSFTRSDPKIHKYSKRVKRPSDYLQLAIDSNTLDDGWFDELLNSEPEDPSLLLGGITNVKKTTLYTIKDSKMIFPSFLTENWAKFAEEEDQLDYPSYICIPELVFSQHKNEVYFFPQFFRQPIAKLMWRSQDAYRELWEQEKMTMGLRILDIVRGFMNSVI
ncbi:hypothetical protein BDZ94DRAFT_1295230 [Collybia nuda]|uniref:Uncharacterized protein n=1 Tax=Collybia nuda TaxID=64659 RepID=A0A9P5YFW3_9AGAR|nr:hypothetical protein BDZ94DRAFT_1295230 [Collybia nuda]